MIDEAGSPEGLRAEAEAEIEAILKEKNCKLTIEEVVHDGKLVRRGVIVVLDG